MHKKNHSIVFYVPFRTFNHFRSGRIHQWPSFYREFKPDQNQPTTVEYSPITVNRGMLDCSWLVLTF